VTSPRLDILCKPLLAISIVVVLMNYEELGTLTNIQWILPIGDYDSPPESFLSIYEIPGIYVRSIITKTLPGALLRG
jgi:hypothetical protein